MTDRSNRDTEYVIVRNGKSKKTTRYYDDTDDDDDDDSQIGTVTRRIVRTKPTKEQHIKYISRHEPVSDHRRQRVVESNDVCISFLYKIHTLFVFFLLSRNLA